MTRGEACVRIGIGACDSAKIDDNFTVSVNSRPYIWVNLIMCTSARRSVWATSE